MVNKNESVWDKIYSTYTGKGPIDQYFYSKLLDVLSCYVNKLDSVLEVGCGSGYMVSHFQKNNSSSIGMDYNRAPLKVAGEKYGAKKLIQGDMFSLPFKDKSFDIVWNEGVLEHFAIEKSISAVKEMNRVSKKYVILALPNRYTLYTLRKLMLKVIGKWSYGYEESYSPRRMRKLMEYGGLDVLNISGIHLPPPLSMQKGLRGLFYLLTLSIPLSENRLKKTLSVFSKMEKNNPALTKRLGYEIVGIGRRSDA